ncbi:MAG: hypothetical protein SGI72_13485 [Planctomycetota bacterium]|nr:hypothetical protein [Planctomycetota bacterium]
MSDTQRPSRLKKALLGVGITLVLLEIVLRFCPVSTGLRPQTVDAEHPIYRFVPSRSYTFSRDWNFALANKGWVNADGFVNDQEYVANDVQPLLAIVGDSFIEAQMVPYGETVQGRLAQKFSARSRFYSFAAAAAPLSQYLVWAQYARDKYAPDALVISVVGNDFDESLAKYSVAVGQHHFVPGADKKLELTRFDFKASAIGPLVYASAFARYLHLNLKLGNRLASVVGALSGKKQPEQHFVGNTATKYTAERLADSLAALERFFELLPTMSGMGPERVLFVVDGMRPDLYDKHALELARTSYFSVMRSSFISKAKSLSYEVIDLQDAFIARYERDHQRFEFTTDYHWNGIGHGVVAEVVEGSQLFQSFQRLVRHGQPLVR